VEVFADDTGLRAITKTLENKERISSMKNVRNGRGFIAKVHVMAMETNERTD